MRRSLRSITTILGLAFHADPWGTASMFFLSAIGQVSMTLYALWLKLLIQGASPGAESEKLVLTAAIALGASWGFSEMAVWTAWKIRVVLQERTSLEIDRRMVEIAASLPGLEHHESPEYANRVAMLRQQREHMALVIGVLVNTVGIAVRAMVTLALLLSLDPLLVLLPLFALPSLWGGARSASINQEAVQSTIERDRRAKHVFKLSTTAGPGKELRIFGLGNEMVGRHEMLWREVDRERTRAALRASIVTASAWLVFAVGYVGTIVLMTMRTIGGDASISDLVLAIILAGQVRGQVSGAVTMFGSLVRILKVVDNFLWLIDYQRTASIGAGTATAPARLEKGIGINGLAFRYPGTDKDVLSGMDLFLPAGSTVAIVGENGAGKTTIVKLLCRFYEPTSGSITVDGIGLESIDLESWRSRLAGGFQDFVKFEFEARRVVGLGDLNRLDDTVAVTGALERAGGGDVVPTLPRGLDTQLGRSFDEGVDVSVGQWQKLALGRAMMRDEPILLVLDEPTASLDAQTEYALFERYSGAARRLASSNGGITLLVSHRFSTVRMADLIIVIDGGRVAESGSHEQLIGAGGLYASLYEMQARSYR